jgi:hypothetical protein
VRRERLDEQLAMKAWFAAAVTLENTKTRMSIVKRVKKFGCGYVITCVHVCSSSAHIMFSDLRSFCRTRLIFPLRSISQDGGNSWPMLDLELLWQLASWILATVSAHHLFAQSCIDRYSCILLRSN